ncbi:MAG: tRNA (adenosine(37)-N6)-dimethylallyltransferase MiaA [Acidiferrobacteraceae bacterium]
MGPTASGKTDLAVRLHSLLPVEIVSVDAAQVYRGLDIGTAKPGREILARAPHRLIDLCDAAETCSAARFREAALAEMEAIASTGRIPLLVGGTIFYFYAIEYGLARLPQADPDVRARLCREAEQMGWPELHRRLMRADPESAARIDPSDRQRIQRALEVIELSGRPMSELRRRAPCDRFPYHPVKIAIAPPARETLHARIAARFRDMLAHGLIDEARWLYGRQDIPPEAPALRIAGYRQVGGYLTGKITHNEMIQEANAATRQLAKRQLTWLRHYPDVHWFDSDQDRLAEQVAAFVQQRLEARRIIGAVVQ